MAKRFSDTAKWGNPSYRSLPNESKLALMYLNDQCDCSGVWLVDYEIASLHLGFRLDVLMIKETLKDHVFFLKDDTRIVLKDFLSFQYGNFDKLTNNVRLGVIRCLDSHGLKYGVLRVGLDYPKGMYRVQEQDKELELVKEKEKESLPISFSRIEDFADQKNIP